MKTRYPLSYIIIGISIAIFLLQNVSELLFGYDYLLLFGAKINAFILQGEIWRLITPVLLHASILHIVFNMYALFSIGPRLERKYGNQSFIALYLVSALWGNTFSFLFSRNASLGASSAIFGLIAAQGVYIYKNRFLLGQSARPMLMNILMVIAINLVLGLNPGIDNWSHLGGLVGGLFYAWFAGPTYGIESTITLGNIIIRQPKNPRLVTIIAIVISALLVVFGFLINS